MDDQTTSMRIMGDLTSYCYERFYKCKMVKGSEKGGEEWR